MRSFAPRRSGSAERKSSDRPRSRGIGARTSRHLADAAGPRRAAPEPAPRAPPVGGANTLPEGLQTVMEAMSGFSLADVIVHRNSAEPAALGALAFAKGNQIHLAPGQERHLPHEAWHVVQQAQGRVKPTAQVRHGASVN